MGKQGIDALVLPVDTMLGSNAQSIGARAAKHRIAAIGPLSLTQFIPLSYGVRQGQTAHRMAYFVDRLLKGAKPADLPVELPTHFELIVNRRSAKAIGVTIADSVLVRADKVID